MEGKTFFQTVYSLKVSNFGIKSYELCESSMGYLWSFIIYIGKDNVFLTAFISGYTNKRVAIILSLVEPLLKKGYMLWVDNFYNSPALAQKLKSLDNDCVGTLCINRKHIPKIVNEKKLKKGELTAQHSGPMSVLKWSDKEEEVTMISTYHWEEKIKQLTKRGQGKEKPVSVLDYNGNMGGVDIKDQLLQPYLLERKKMTTWYIKMFMRLLNVTILNCKIICMQIQASQKWIILNSEWIWYRFYLLNAAVNLKGKCNAIIPLTKMYRDCSKGIFPKEYHLQRKRSGQQKGVWCATNATKGRRQCFGATIVRLDFVLRAVSRHFTPS
jgi:hypothetical protein